MGHPTANMPNHFLLNKICLNKHSVKKQVQLHLSRTAVSSEDSSATDLSMLQTQHMGVHVCTGTYKRIVYAMGEGVCDSVVHNLWLCMYVLERTGMQHKVRHIYTGTYMLMVGVWLSIS